MSEGHVAAARRFTDGGMQDSLADGDVGIRADDVDMVRLELRQRRRLKSTLSGLSGFLTGVGASLSFAAPSVVTVVDLVA